MKSFRKELWFHVPKRRAFINITPQVEECHGLPPPLVSNPTFDALHQGT